MSLIQVIDVVKQWHSTPPATVVQRWLARGRRRFAHVFGPGILHFDLDHPQAGTTVEGHVLPISGWVCSSRERVRSVLVETDCAIQRLEVRLPRHDAATLLPKAVGAPHFGFLGYVSTLGLPCETELSLTALLDSGRRVKLGTVQLHREPLISAYRPRRRPLLLYSFGRSGSSWTMRLLREHPQVIVAGCFPHEVRASQYWARVAHLLSQPFPAGMDCPPRGNWMIFEPRGWGGTEAEQMNAWFRQGYVEELVAAMQSRTDDYYARVAECLGRPESVYFAEKVAFPFTVPLMREFYPSARVVFLVRDFRDMFCSIRSYNARHHVAGFGRKYAASDDDHVWSLAGWMADFRRTLNEYGPEAVLIRYEDLVRQPRDTLAHLFGSLGLDASPELIAALISRASAPTAASAAHRTTPTADQSIGRWRTELSTEQRRTIQAAFGDLLVAFGYEADTGRLAA